MNPARLAAACVLSGLALCPVARGTDASRSSNPYHEIHERNVFGLQPPPPPHPAASPEPLPKVLLTGLTTILGNKRALLKVQFPSALRRPPKEEFCILTEGQRDGAIEVLRINEKTESVTVDNSGTVMEITFEKPGPAPAPSPSRPQTYPAKPVVQTVAHWRTPNRRPYR